MSDPLADHADPDEGLRATTAASGAPVLEPAQFRELLGLHAVYLTNTDASGPLIDVSAGQSGGRYWD